MTCKYFPLFKAATFSACLLLLEIFSSFIINVRFSDDASAGMLTPSWLIIVFTCGIFLNCVLAHRVFLTSCGMFCRRPPIINWTFLRDTGQVAYGSESTPPVFRQSRNRSIFIDFHCNSPYRSPGTVCMRVVSPPGWNLNEMFDCLIKPNHHEKDFADKL